MKRFSKILNLVVVGLVGVFLTLGFQNCGTMESADNPLYDDEDIKPCLGVNCEEDLQYVRMDISMQLFSVENQIAGTTCNASNCFDVAGTCDTGGYPGSVFYYQWILDGAADGTTTQQAVRTAVACDENGRFRILVKVPTSKYRWDRQHKVKVYMKVIDDKGKEVVNSVGDSERTLDVMTRT